jgi:hypothetical protein
MTPDQVKESIVRAFSGSEYPGDWCLIDSLEGDEPALLAQEFKGKTEWRTLDPSFIDQAPDGFGSALSFFSDEAYRFYLPAYLVASIDGKLQQADPVFSLTHGLDDASRAELINPRRYGERTWFDAARHKFAVFTAEQAGAIVAYLNLMAEMDEFARSKIRQALGNYWTGRASPG